MKNQSSKSKGFKPYFAIIVILCTLLISVLLFYFVLGHHSNFVGDNPDNNPKEGNYFGIIYKGGFVVPFLMSFLMMVVTFSIERTYTIMLATGKGSIEDFVVKVKGFLNENNINAAIGVCEEQKGSVG